MAKGNPKGQLSRLGLDRWGRVERAHGAQQLDREGTKNMGKYSFYPKPKPNVLGMLL